MMTDEKKEITDLVSALCNGTLSEDKYLRLDQLLRDSPSFRDFYLSYVDVHLKLVDGAKLGWFTDSTISAFPELVKGISCEGAEQLTGELLKDNPKSDLVKIRNRFRRPLLLAIACTLACVALGVSLLFHSNLSESHLAESVKPGVPVDASAEIQSDLIHDNQLLYVAQITAATEDVVWGDASDRREFLLRVRAGDYIDIESGLVKVDFFSGASLILRGPCSFLPTGENSGLLTAGELTGKVSVGDFFLTTPTAMVVDLGTEFGVSVDHDNSTNVRVYDGKVRVTTSDDKGDVNSRLLSEGMAVRTGQRGQLISTRAIQRDYTRVFPRAESNWCPGSFSLVDALSCDEYGQYRIATAIAADTGEVYEQSMLETEEAKPRQRRGTYHSLRWHPFVDGVFIPSNHGSGVQCDSSGRTINLVPNGAQTSGPVWARQRIEDSSEVVFHKNFWGRKTRKRVLDRLRACDQGMIGIHANVGLTFDLDAIRKQCDQEIVLLRTIVSNLDNSDDHKPAPTDERRFIADFRVFLDGVLKRSRLGFGRTDGDVSFEIPIGKADRFLTFVSTDAGHYWYDQVVMIDPMLVLAPMPQVAVLRNTIH